MVKIKQLLKASGLVLVLSARPKAYRHCHLFFFLMLTGTSLELLLIVANYLLIHDMICDMILVN